MAVSLTGGGVGDVETATSVTSGSTGITVPADAQLAILCIGGWDTATGRFTGGTYEIDSVGFTESETTDGQNTNEQMWIGYLNNPSTGSQTFSWAPVADVSDGATYVIVFVKGRDANTPINDSDKSDTDEDVTGMNAGAGDMMIGVVGDYATTPTVTDDSQTELYTGNNNNGGIGVAYEIGEGDFYSTTDGGYESAAAVVIKAAVAAAAGNIIPYLIHRQFMARN